MPTHGNPVVSGEILFRSEMASFSNATVFIYLEDVSLQDVSAKVVGKQIVENISHAQETSRRMQFAIYGARTED